MATRRSYMGLSMPGFVSDHHSVTRSNGGRQVAWALVPNTFKIAGTDDKFIPAGTVMSVVSSADAVNKGKVVPRSAEVVNTTDERFVAETNMEEASRNDAKTGYGMIDGGNLYENLMPDSAGNPKVLPDDYKDELGPRFRFYQYEDSRAG